MRGTKGIIFSFFFSFSSPPPCLSHLPQQKKKHNETPILEQKKEKRPHFSILSPFLPSSSSSPSSSLSNTNKVTPGVAKGRGAIFGLLSAIFCYSGHLDFFDAAEGRCYFCATFCYFLGLSATPDLPENTLCLPSPHPFFPLLLLLNMGGSAAAIKLGGCVAIFAIAFVGIMLPVKWRWIAESRVMLGRANSFAAGVFIALALIHLLPEAMEGMWKGQERLAPFTCAAGYLLILAVEAFAKPAPSEALLGSELQQRDDEDDIMSLEPETTSRAKQEIPPIMSIVLTFALSLHSLIEGLSIGVEAGEAEVLLLVLSISAHKLIAAIALGANFSSEGITQNVALMGSIFAVSTPIGVLIGWAANGVLPPVADAFIQALSAGTFLYIGTSGSCGGKVAPRSKLPFMTLGIVVIYVLTISLDFD